MISRWFFFSTHQGRYPIISDFSETYYIHWDDKRKDARSVPLTVELLQIEVSWYMMWFHRASKNDCELLYIIHSKEICTYNPYPTAFPYGNGMVLHFYQQQESSTTKTVHKVINKGLKAYV